MNVTKWSVLSAFVLLLFATRVVSQPAPDDIGQRLYARGYTATIAKGDLYFDTSQPISVRYAFGTLNPNSAVLCNGPCTGGRWGWDKHVKGYIVGPEGTSVSQAQAALDHGCLSELGMPAGYRVSELDYYSMMYAKSGSLNSYYAARVQTCPVNPPPEPTPTPNPTPSPTPAPTPEPTPPPCPTCTDAPRLSFTERCIRALQQLAQGKPNGPKRTEAVRDDCLPTANVANERGYYVPADQASSSRMKVCTTP